MSTATTKPDRGPGTDRIEREIVKGLLVLTLFGSVVATSFGVDQSPLCLILSLVGLAVLIGPRVR